MDRTAEEVSNTSSYEYIHFKTSKECEIHLINNRHIHIAYQCCGGKGYAILRKNAPSQILRRTKYILPCPEDPSQVQTVKGTCDICFGDDKTLHSTCTTCKQPFCMDCLQKLPTKSCPYCRGILQ
jgi:hypothetical protein